MNTIPRKRENPVKIDNSSAIEASVTKHIDDVSDGGKVAIVKCANAFRFGGTWGFIKATDPDFKSTIELLAEERPQVKVIKVSNGALILCSAEWLATNVNALAPNAIGDKFIERVTKRRAEEKEKFVKFVENIAKGKNAKVQKKNGYYELTLGVFCVNDTNAIRLNGIDYPAYKLTAIEALDYVSFLEKAGMQVFAKYIKEDSSVGFAPIRGLASNSGGVTALHKGLEIAESETGAFLTLRIK